MQAIKPTCLCSRHQALSSIPVSAFKSLSAVTRHAQAAPETSQRQAACYKRSVCIPLQAVGKGFGTPKPKVTDTAAVTPTSQCPCQSGKEYQSCCQVFHLGAARADTPEKLLRSRYCAYVVKDPEYIADTTHPECSEYSGSRKAYVTRVTATQRALEPRGLTIKAVEPGSTEDEVFIDFTVKRSTRAKAGTDKGRTEESMVDERSRFVRDDGKWFWMSSSFPEGASKLSRP